MDSGSYFEVVSEVSESWDKIKRIPTYDEMFGVALFHRMFEIAPDKWELFPWKREDFENKNEKFIVFTKKFVRMLDMAVHMLGPDMDIVEEQMYDLGSSHERYGVTPEHFDLMGQALIHTLKMVLGPRSFMDRTEQSWQEIYSFMTKTMIKGATGE
jgi:hemoglobin-like flavoprotein